MENEANEFASALLMPAKDISPTFRGRRVNLQLLAALKREWKVAMQALLVRAASLGFVTPNQNRYLWQQISIRGWRLREPAELDFPPEKPSVLSAIIKTHLVDLGYDNDDFANLIKINENEFQEFYSEVDCPTPDKPRLRIVR